ncbi:MAG TPA: HD domain-containing phosphohydrolase [Magnetospirillum sp.]|nr:HD domain-containing phosphohydrolase [Magnetospirillum sp.]
MLVQIVDDNDTNLMLFEQLALRIGPDIEVTTHADPVQALEACRATVPDMIVVDFMMPRMDGHEYVQAVRKLPGMRDVPIVMVTAAAERSVRQKALELGVTDFLAKPVDPAEARVRFSNLLALRRGHLQLRDRNRWLADEVRKATATVIEREQELILRLSKAAEFRDPETGAHIVRMAHYSQLIAARMGLGSEFCDLILKAAPMHDLGKLGIPDGILLKPGKLTDEEFSVMTKHPLIGYEILSGSNSQLIQLGAEIALSHHEKFDGTGYPHRLAGEAIPLSGRIVAVADVFDALTSERPYKAAWPVEKARQLLVDNAGSHFDPACVEAFLAEWDQVLAIRAKLSDVDQPLF